ncbi:MAG: hypothetical protein PHI02_00915 [Sulfurovaceae bacterium]|nr:hypothetical protein [Sulfurovaceae bacterium]
MKKLLIAMGILFIGSTYVNAGIAPVQNTKSHPTAFLGVTYSFGGGVGISLKALSTNKEDSGVVSGGVTYYPLTNKFGVSLGGGYLVKNGAATLEWDFLNGTPIFNAGYAKTKDDKTVAPALILAP